MTFSSRSQPRPRCNHSIINLILSAFFKYLCLWSSNNWVSALMNFSCKSSICWFVGLSVFPASIGAPTTVVMRCRRGMRPNEYWKKPRPMKMHGEMPVSFLTVSWNFLINVPGWLEGWSKTSTSLKENTGTSEAPACIATFMKPFRFLSTSW